MSELAHHQTPSAARVGGADAIAGAGLPSLARRCAEEFETRFGGPARWVVASPGRVNLIGEHVDYNDGFVLPMAIERYVVIAAAPPSTSDASRDGASAGHRVRLASTRQEQVIAIDLDEPMRPGEPAWGNYARGVIAGFQDRGAKVSSFDALIAADLPTGGGLSSSAALEVALATLLEVMTGLKLEPRDKALLCQHAEHTFAGVPCGIMDQFACALGRKDHLLLLDCRSLAVEFVPFRDPQVTVLVIDSKVKHELSGGEYARRRRDCEAATAKLGVSSLRDLSIESFEACVNKLSEIQQKRARHVVSEIQRTQDAVAAIRKSDWGRVGELMYESHRSLRDDYEVSCAELDVIVDLARGHNETQNDAVFGCRMTGGGFGGCAVCLVRTAGTEAVSEHIAAEYERRTGVRPAIFSTHPADGAKLLSVVP
ncbi:MAG: galactokinase [Phycisphaeraceae bacterium]